MSTLSSTFPTSTALPGLTFSVYRRPEAMTFYRTRESARDVTSPAMTYPLHEIELQFSVLRQSTLPAYSELQTIAGFFLSRRGAYKSFLFSDPIDSASSNSQIGVGNGVQRTFQFNRSRGPYFTEPVDQIGTVTAVRISSVTQVSSNYTIVQPNFITFSTLIAAPTSTQTVNADFSFYYLMRFSEDVSEYEQFMKTLYTLKKCKLRSARL